MTAMKWQAGPGTLFGKKQQFNPNPDSRIITPDTAKNKEGEVLRVTSVGPDVNGFHEGDIVAYEKATAFPGGVFVRVRDVLGRLVPSDAPNSAVLSPNDVEKMAQAE